MADIVFDPDLYTVEEVNELVDTAKQQIADGIVTIQFTSLGSSGTFIRSCMPSDILRAAKRFFSLVDPVTGERKRVGRKTATAYF